MTAPLSNDHIFVQKLTDIVLANLQEENFGVDELAREAGVSRFVILRKLRKVNDQNISQFIREVRLKRAMELLRHHAGSASEIAYSVGFGSPAYFTKCFHDYYGYPPGNVIKMPLPADAGIQINDETKAIISDELYPVGDKMSVVSTGKKHYRRAVFGLALLVLCIAAWLFFNQTKNRDVSLNDIFHKQTDMSIIVLPFKNLSLDPQYQYFADGLMEDIINNLFLVSDLKVISRATSEYFRETGLTASEIGQKVNSRHLLEGSIRVVGNKARITVQLIDTHRDRHLWSANFDRSLSDVLGVQNDIALQVAYELNAALSDSEFRKISSLPTQNVEAYDYYLRGRFLLHKANGEQRADFSREGVMSCLKHFEMAIKADSSFVQAYASLANAWLNLSAWGWIAGGEGFEKARELSLKAIALDPDCAEAHAVLGAYLVWPRRNFEEGRKELLTAIKLNPNFSTARQWYAQLLMITGPVEEARLQVDRALELERYLWITHTLSGWIYYFEEAYDKAIEACLLSKDLKRKYSDNQWLLFLNYVKVGDGQNAVRELQGIVNEFPGGDAYAEEILEAYRSSGIDGLFVWLIDVNINNPLPDQGLRGHPFIIAWWHAILGNQEEALYWLERNMELRNRLYHYFNLIANNPDFDGLRNEPRFLAIVDEIGLSPYHHRAKR